MDGSGSSPGSGAADDYRRRLRELFRANPGMLMNVLEEVAAAEEKAQLRLVVEAVFFIFSGEEESLPGGRDFWTRMRTNLSPSQENFLPQDGREAGWKAVSGLRRQMDRYASDRPELRRVWEEFDRRGPMPSLPAPSEAQPFAQVISPLPPPPPVDGGPGGLNARLERAEAELGKKDFFIKELDAELRRLREQLRAREDTSATKTIEEKLVVHEEETRLARADLAKLEKKYRENLELLKEEARDRGSLQKQLDNTQAEVFRAQGMLKDEQEKLADAHRRLDKRERELETVEERLHSMEIELVRKEEEISMAMQHLRDEEAERRRVLDALRQEARDKAQMEHRLKRREEELSRLETRIVEEEKRIAALKGSQAVSEEESLRKAAELRRREEEVRSSEATMQARLSGLRAEEEAIRERVSRLKKELREGEVLEAQLRKREELRAALEERYRQKEAELVRELRELERVKAGLEEREGASWPRPGEGRSAAEAEAPAPSPLPGGSGMPAPAAPPTPAEGPAPGPSLPEAPALPPVRPAPMIRMLVVPAPPEPAPAEPPGAPPTPTGLFPETEQNKGRTHDELLDILARKKKTKQDG